MRTLQKNSAFLSIELATKYYRTCCNAKSLVATTAITDDIHKLDLLGIPRQHTQIMHNHQRFLEQVEEMRQGIESHINQTRRALEQGKTTLQQQMQEWERCFKQAEWQQAFGLQQQYKILAVQVNHQIQEDRATCQ